MCFLGSSWSPLHFFFWSLYKIEHSTSSEALMVSFMYILSLHIQSQSACDSAHCYKPFLQNYCVSISYLYSACRLIIYTKVKNLALVLVGLYSIFPSHFIDFSNLVWILILNSYLFTASHTGIICKLNSPSHLQLKYWVQDRPLWIPYCTFTNRQ